MKTLLSLFDYSGQWSEPFARNGWNVIQWDIKLDEFMDVNNIDLVETALELFENVDGIIAAPPCTEFTASCAQYWNMKDADGRTEAALQLVSQVMKLVNLFQPTDPGYDGTFFWGLENPVGRLNKLVPELGKGFFFHPWQYAGHVCNSPEDLQELERIRAKNGFNVSPSENAFVIACNAYTKKTGLWGDFNRNLELKPIEPVKCAPQGSFTQRLGGKSAKTKEERSHTPEGFANAFYEANKDWREGSAWKKELEEAYPGYVEEDY